jgi:predicted DNA-binding protein YlxM (UPF0122 family)
MKKNEFFRAYKELSIVFDKIANSFAMKNNLISKRFKEVDSLPEELQKRLILCLPKSIQKEDLLDSLHRSIDEYLHIIGECSHSIDNENLEGTLLKLKELVILEKG